MSQKSQNLAILEYMKAGNSITSLEALRKFNCFRLAARIYDLRWDGFAIGTQIIEMNGKHIARYHLL